MWETATCISRFFFLSLHFVNFCEIPYLHKVYMCVTLYLTIMSVVAFVLFGLDKRYAKNGHRRISEMMLLFIAGLGGSVGALLAMLIFRHKTRKRLFKLGVPLIMVVQALIIWIICQ